VAVLAGGHDHIYPPEHVPLVQSLLPAGAAPGSQRGLDAVHRLVFPDASGQQP